MKLTIGMAHANDFHGVFFTVQALRIYQDLTDCEIIIIDNTPDTDHGKQVAEFVGSIKNAIDIKYIPFTVPGTTQTREEIFKQASGDAVLCMDCHVMLLPNAIKRLKEYYKSEPREGLYSGPLIYDDLRGVSTHFDFIWRSEMWGIWGTARECSCGFKYSYNEGKFYNLETQQKEIIHKHCPKCAYPLSATGKVCGKDPNDEPFTIPAQGLGLFTCMKKEWLGFNPHFRNFGGEECYIHEKYRQAGKKTMCLPFLGWNHRFGRPGGAPYVVDLNSKIKNYIHGALELKLSLNPIKEHFSKKINDDGFNSLVEQCKKEIEGSVKMIESKPAKEKIFTPETIKEIRGKAQTETYLAVKDYIVGPTISDYSMTADILFNLMGEDNIKEIYYLQYNDKQHTAFLGSTIENKVFKDISKDHQDYTPVKTDTAIVNMNCNLQVANFVMEKAKECQRIIAHGVTKGEEVSMFLNTWAKNNGFGAAKILGSGGVIVVLEKGEPKDLDLGDIKEGAGTYLKKYLKVIGIEATEQCKCNMRAKTMNMMGPTWCEENIEQILDWLAEEATSRKLPFMRIGAKLFVKRAINQAKKDFKKKLSLK